MTAKAKHAKQDFPWAHGTNYDPCPASGADAGIMAHNPLAMVDAIKAAKGNVKFTVYPGVGHNSWSKTYSNPELYKWFLSHKRKTK